MKLKLIVNNYNWKDKDQFANYERCWQFSPLIRVRNACGETNRRFEHKVKGKIKLDAEGLKLEVPRDQNELFLKNILAWFELWQN